MTLLESGDEVLVFDPDYAAYARLARLLGATPVPCPAGADFRVSVDEVKRRLTPGQLAGAPDGAAGHLHAGRQAADHRDAG
jgi:aspartate/methionine/tyrosine aminotransferase